VSGPSIYEAIKLIYISRDGNIRYYEIEGDTIHALSEHKSTEPQRGMCFLPRRALNVNECEIARAYKITTAASAGAIEPIAFVVPRKADTFQADIYPPAPSKEPSVDAATYFTTRKDIVRRVVDLDTGFTTQASSTSLQIPPTSAYPTSEPSSAISPISPPTNKSAPLGSSTLSSSFAPSAQTSASGLGQTLSSTFKAAPAQEYNADNDVSVQVDAGHFSHLTLKEQLAALADENARLNGELREARNQIRTLELQLEAMRANAQRAAKVLLEN
jgi:coronin-1B/1C/6